MPDHTILVIDDDKLVRWSMSVLLARAGYTVHEAATGADGLAAVQTCHPDLVLLDILLPDIDGFGVLRAIRQARPELPVLMMTAEPDSETRKQALSLGARAHMEKPCDASLLQEAVANALQSASSKNKGDA